MCTKMRSVFDLLSAFGRGQGEKRDARNAVFIP